MGVAAKENCTGCSACYSICPNGCIKMEPDIEGFLEPVIDEQKCSHCGLCEKICPVNNKPKAYAVINRDETIRSKSTSGGMFQLFAQQIIKQNGTVFGVGFDEKFSVKHSSTKTLEGLAIFRRSKYVQSDIGDTFKNCKQLLENGEAVLYSGTPCQIAGLKTFLQKDYQKLLCLDIICMSVPSPKLWENYLKYQTKRNSSGIKNIAFRYKQPNWKQSKLHIFFENGETYVGIRDPYSAIFSSDLCARRSCYKCRFRNFKRESDITIADFWGIEKVFPEIDDNKGTSLVFVNSSKGEEYFNEINDLCIVKPVEVNDAVQYNFRAIQSPVYNMQSVISKRQKIFANIGKMPFDKIVKSFVHAPLPIRAYRFARRCLGKIKRMVLK
jgi:coenzyme F420-reducing hydrogenase beta subunit